MTKTKDRECLGLYTTGFPGFSFNRGFFDVEAKKFYSC